ncbi:unnamed protein product [Linum trigynum]|uniref:Uncharacterized protein n=1 Tax=Linum trigynum TaxID=586398 RepID=A0AAV2F9J8_9ROSI
MICRSYNDSRRSIRRIYERNHSHGRSIKQRPSQSKTTPVFHRKKQSIDTRFTANKEEGKSKPEATGDASVEVEGRIEKRKDAPEQGADG